MVRNNLPSSCQVAAIWLASGKVWRSGRVVVM